MLLEAGAKMPPALVKAFDAAPEAATGSDIVPARWAEHEARFSYELLRRARGGKAKEDLDWARGITPGSKPWPFPGLHRPIARLLTKNEREILIDKEHFQRDVERRLKDKWKPAEFGSRRSRTEPRFVLAGSYPTDFLSGASELSGCHDDDIFVDVDCRRTGAPGR